MNSFLKIKFKSGALQFAIFTSAIIALLLLGLILYLHSYKILEQKTYLTIESIKEVNNSFVKVAQSKTTSLDTTTILENDFKSTKHISDFWGVFQKTKVISKVKNKEFEKIALLGGKHNKKERVSLYLKNTFKPLVVVGNTVIKGKVKLSNQGVRAGNIAGNSYYGNQLIYGSVGVSAETLPRLNADLLKYLKDLDRSGNSLVNENYFELKETNINSFFEPTKWLYENGIIDIKDGFIGNYIIKSDTLVRIKKHANLKDVLILAPNVIIEDGVKGTFQVIATNNIHVGKNVKLDYPSCVLVVNKNIVIEKENRLFIDENSTVKGVVGFLNKENVLRDNFLTQVHISKSSLVYGEVYCEGNLELQGKVIGTVFSNQFVVNAAGTIFINHLLDARINSIGFSDFYGGILLNNQSKSIVKWLY
ncbi:MAG: hypothetical protein ACJAYP_000208 [Flavobacterium sp.]